MAKPAARCRPCSAVSVESHLDWAAGIAGQVARKQHLTGPDRDELVSRAHLTICELIAKPITEGGFDASRANPGDVSGAFRGWAVRWVRCACRREAERLRGGGLFHTVRPENLRSTTNLGEADGDLSSVTQLPDDVQQPKELTTPFPCSTVVRGRRIAEGNG